MEKWKSAASGNVLADLDPNIEIWKPDDRRGKSTREMCSTKSTRGTLVESNGLRRDGGPSARAKPVAPGTGVYFCDASSENDMKSEGCPSDLQDLVTLTIVACEIEASSRCHQLVKKRRTPRNLVYLKGSLRNNSKRKLPEGFGALAIETSQRSDMRNLKYHDPGPVPWEPDVSTLEPNDVRQIENKVCSSSPNIKLGSCPSTTEALAIQPDHGVGEFKRVADASRPLQTCGAKFSGSSVPQVHVHSHETRVQRFARRILQFVGEKTIAEKFIRRSLGNNPDTSKALRLLLKQQKISRLGEGGRGKAFVYVVTTAGLEELEGLKDVQMEP